MVKTLYKIRYKTLKRGPRTTQFLPLHFILNQQVCLYANVPSIINTLQHNGLDTTTAAATAAATTTKPITATTTTTDNNNNDDYNDENNNDENNNTKNKIIK